MVPDGWKMVRLGNIAETVTSGSRDWAQYYSDSGSKFIRMTNLRRDGVHLKLENMKYVNVISNSSDGKRTSLQSGDILISITAELGKIGWIPEKFGEAYINQHTALVRLKKAQVNSLYVAYLLSSKYMNYVINSLNDSGAKAGLNLPTIRGIPLALPPTTEQKKIVKILSTWVRAIDVTEKLISNSQQQKRSLMQQLLTGKKRLPKFDGEWEKIELGELLDYRQPTPFLVKSTEYNDEYAVPVLTAGKTFVLGYTNECTGIFQDELPAIIFDDFTTASKFVDFPFKAKSSAMKILTAKEGVFIKFVFEAMQMLNYAVGGHQRHWISIYSNIVINMPKFDEQQRISSVLKVVDQEVEALQHKLGCLKQEKKALMQQLLTGKKRVIPN